MAEEEQIETIELDEEHERVYDLLPAINGYAEVFSVFAGEPVAIRAAHRVQRGPWRFLERLKGAAIMSKIEIRDAVTGQVIATPPVPPRLPILPQLPKSYRDEGAGYACRVVLDTAGWPPGLYECVIHDQRGERSEGIFFNLKPAESAAFELFCVLPSYTWQAYNRIAGGSFYSPGIGNVRVVSTQRPISRKRDNYIDAAIAFLKAFAEAGVRYTCVDSADLHFDRLPQGPVPVIALLTHDEYWSEPMRAAIDRHLGQRGSLLVAAGNVCWWRIDIEGDNIVVNKEPKLNGLHKWCRVEPEERTFAASFRFGGYALERALKKPYLAEATRDLTEDQVAEARAMRVEMPDHPIFEGVTLGDGNQFGAAVPLMYREVDAVPLNEAGTLNRIRYDADEVKLEIIATGVIIPPIKRRRTPRRRKGVPSPIPFSPVVRAGVVVGAKVGPGYVLHLGSFGWSLGLVEGHEDVKRVVLNAYRHCREIAARRRGRFAGRPQKPAEKKKKSRARTS